MGSRSRKSKRRVNSIFMMLVLATALMVVSTYAWFSVNREVEITGITAKVAAAEGLQISLDGKEWGSSVDVNSTVLTALTTAKNNFTWPTEISPVSTTGATTAGIVDFYNGEISADGSTLSKATKIVEATSNNPYIAFDIYLKNSSSNITTGDVLRLGAGSSVAIHNPGGTDANDDRVGQSNTGLENSIRTAIALYSTTQSFTAGQTAYNNIAPSSGVQGVAIWEPNYNAHIQEIADNDSARVPTTSADFRTLAIKALPTAQNGVVTLERANAAKLQSELTSEEIAGGAVGADGNYYARQATIKTNGTTGATDPGNPTDGHHPLLAVDGTTTLTLAANKVSKARIYIWLEGQDPDCIDTASTGKYIDVRMLLNKPAND